MSPGKELPRASGFGGEGRVLATRMHRSAHAHTAYTCKPALTLADQAYEGQVVQVLPQVISQELLRVSDAGADGKSGSRSRATRGAEAGTRAREQQFARGTRLLELHSRQGGRWASEAHQETPTYRHEVVYPLFDGKVFPDFEVQISLRLVS